MENGSIYGLTGKSKLKEFADQKLPLGKPHLMLKPSASAGVVVGMGHCWSLES